MSQPREIELKARRAWEWVVVQVLWVFISTKGLLFVVRNIPELGKWLITHFVFYNAVVSILTHGLLILTSFWCSQARSVRDFANGVGLSRRPNLQGVFFALGAIGIGLFSIYGAMKWLTVGNPVGAIFRSKGGEVLSLYNLYAIIVGPFAEEVGERGFLYRAFRGSYGMLLSTTLIVCLDLFFHWQMALHSVYSFACISLFAIMVCIVRERTVSIWNCILFHAVYNSVTLKQWPVSIIIMLTFSVIVFTNRNKKMSTWSDECKEK